MNSKRILNFLVLFRALQQFLLLGSTTGAGSSITGDNDGPLFDEQLELVAYELQKLINMSDQLAERVPRQLRPTNTEPFVFFHVRKAGGLSLRAEITQATKRQNLSAWVPCILDPCIPYTYPPFDRLGKTAVYASHMNYVGIVQQILEKSFTRVMSLETVPVHNGTGEASINPVHVGRPPFTCLTNLRSTVSRVISCWNFRMQQEGARHKIKAPLASEMSPDDWVNLLPIAADAYSKGCNNELARVFGSTYDEAIVNRHHLSEPTFLPEFNRIASRMSKCVVIELEKCQESTEVIRHFLPWLGNGIDLCSSSVKQNVGEIRQHTDSATSSAVSDAILSQNTMDELLYRFGESLFNAQFQIAKEAAAVGLQDFCQGET
eukprot:CAMPEP_0206369024 /NCGR_PEP_ID=MMETSP0294-20121207/5040_1 /ASSEMBLY_ACC=CAM_ASM_000327 /TAXON_ID=39354 /ORGANISM="Heterosigma akashiwo, Strain CCMP2393" /LENGTH=376 /DNA_ID=CAMNT_0053815679 /DNA_START=12 /DNA_END=1142 /DNA_ORIENTATION=-